MSSPAGWLNPIHSPPGQKQPGVDPRTLLPARRDLVRARLEFQRALLLSGRERFTPIAVTRSGVICDGHHAVRAAAEEGRDVNVLVVLDPAVAASDSILILPLR